MIDEFEKLAYEIDQKVEHDKIVLLCAEYYLDYGYSVRKIAQETDIPKSTVGDYLTKHLKDVNYDKWLEVQFEADKRKQW